MKNFSWMTQTLKFDKIKIISKRENKRIAFSSTYSSQKLPRNIGITTKNFSLFWFNNSESGPLIIALLVECFSCKSMLASSKNQLNFYFLAKIIDEFIIKKLFINFWDYSLIRYYFWIQIINLNVFILLNECWRDDAFIKLFI